MNELDPEEMVGARAACRLLGDIHRATLERRLIEDPEFPRPYQYKRNGPRYWRRAEILAYRERHRCARQPRAA